MRCLVGLCLTIVSLLASTAMAAERPPNFVVIFADDLGYGDLGCFGHPTIRTPHLDRMAAEGMKFTQWYSASSVCTPSRAGLLTGRLPQRSGMCGVKRRVLFPDSKGGLPESEITLAEALKTKGYATGCVGKWHLGHKPEHLPTAHGFDSFFGLPYSNDMDRVPDKGPKDSTAFWEPKTEYWNVPLLRGTEVIERPADQNTLTRRYTDEAVKFIEQHKAQPFFLYFPQTFPHVPLFASDEFRGKSLCGIYGDVVEELDASVGRVLDKLRELKIDEQTLVIFTSDNGPWLPYGNHGGNAGPLRDGKGSTWEGGMREPTIAWWPKHIRPLQTSTQIASTMDIFATACALAGVELPSDREMDSYDLSPTLLGTGACARNSHFFYRGQTLMAARVGAFKAHYVTQSGYGRPQPEQHATPLLFNVEVDPGEKQNIAAKHPEVLAEIAAAVEAHRAKMKFAESQLDR